MAKRRKHALGDEVRRPLGRTDHYVVARCRRQNAPAPVFVAQSPCGGGRCVLIAHGCVGCACRVLIHSFAAATESRIPQLVSGGWGARAR